MNESGYATFKAHFTFDQELIKELFNYGYYEAEISSESAVVINAETKEIIFEKNAFLKKSMASTTKIMSGMAKLLS